MMIRHSTVDKTCFLLSLGCSLHCLILPIFLSLTPIIGLNWFADERIEHLFLLISGLLAIGSICYGFNKHGKKHVLAILAVGIAFMAIGHMTEENVVGVFIAVIGGLSISLSHFINYKLCKTCDNCGD